MSLLPSETAGFDEEVEPKQRSPSAQDQHSSMGEGGKRRGARTIYPSWRSLMGQHSEEQITRDASTPTTVLGAFLFPHSGDNRGRIQLIYT